MIRVNLNLVIRSVPGHALSSIRMYVYERGTTTEAIGYTTETGAAEVTYPLESDDEGRFPDAWYPPGPYDLFSPDDAVNPTQPWEAGLGWAAYQDGYYLGDVPLPGPDGKRMGHAGLAFDDVVNKSYLGGASFVNEVGDPGELIGGRAPGVFPHGPVGASTVLAADTAPGATEFWVTRASEFPLTCEEWQLAIHNELELIVGDQPITYDAKASSATTTRVAGLHAIGAVEVAVADAGKYPTAGRLRIADDEFAYSGQGSVYDGTVNGAHLAGSETLTLNSVAGLPAAGSVRVVTFGAVVREHRYSSIVGNVLQLHIATPLQRNVPNGAAVSMDKLTGVEGERRTVLVGPHTAGDDELRVASVLGIPASGEARVLSTVELEPLPDLIIDEPVRRVAYDSVTPDAVGDGGTLNLPAPLADDAKAGNEVWIEGVTGLTVELLDYKKLTAQKITGVKGLTSGETAGAIMEFNERWRSPLPGNSSLVLRKGNLWSPNGYQSFTFMDVIGSRQDAFQRFWGGEYTWQLATMGPNSFRKTILKAVDEGIGLGSDLGINPDQIAYMLHIGRPHARIQTPGSDLELEDEDVPPGQIAASAVYVTATVGWPTAGRFVAKSAWNSVTETTMDREFDYTTLVATTLLNGAHTLPDDVVTVDSTVGFTDSGHITLDDGVDVTTVYYASKTSTEFLNCEFGSGSLGDNATVTQTDNIGFRGVTYDGADGYAIGDFWLPAGNHVVLADRVQHVSSAARGQVMANEGQNAQTSIGNVGPTTADPEPGIKMGDIEVYERSDGKLGIESAVAATEAYADLAVPAVAARVSHSTTQSIADNTATALAFDTEIFDTDAIHDAGTNTRLTAPVAGIYEVKGSMRWNTTGGGVRELQIRFNNTTNIAGSVIEVAAGANAVLHITTIYQFAAGDYVEARGKQITGGALSTLASSPQYPSFSINRIGA